MILITRCPTCETMFKVVPDQLRVSEGWVRCGQCAEIFDATQNMVASPESETPVPPAPAQVQRAPAPPAAPPAHTPTPTFIRPAADAQAAAVALDDRSERAPQAAVPARPHDVPEADDEPDWTDAPLTDPETVFLERDSEAEPPTQPPEEGTEAEPSQPEPAPSSPRISRSTPVREAEPAEVPPVSFLRKADTPSLWNRPAMRWSLLLVLLALLALLIVQIVLKERNHIAAVEPAARPVLQALCGITGCSLSPLRQIESIVIDSSSFSRVRGDDYRLGFALRNTAAIAIAMPSIELSLTDPQDQAVIRRVIQPAEFAAGALAMAKASVWSGSLALSVKPGASTDRIAGYRLLAFYP